MDVQKITHALGGVYRNGKGLAACPICQPERRPDQNALSLSAQNGKTLLFCFKGHCSFVEIANAVSLPLGSVQIDFDAQRKTDEKQAAYSAEKLKKARSLWAASKPIENTKAGTYLRGRGITCELPPSLRFMPDIFHGATMTWACAMIANVEPTGGVHRTFFDKTGKRLDKNAKLMLGPCAGGHVTLAESNGPLVVCEGIETGLALASGLLLAPATIWAALSTSGMKSLKLPSDPARLTIATDGDAPGREAGNALATRAAAQGWDVSLLPAPDGTDWADVIMAGGTI